MMIGPEPINNIFWMTSRRGTADLPPVWKEKETLQEGLITVDKKTVYRIDDDIPVMLIEMGICLEKQKA